MKRTMMRALILLLACASIAPAQNLRTLTRATSTTGLNDSALVLVSDSASRTRAVSTHELFKRPRGTTSHPSYSFALDSTTGLNYDGTSLTLLRAGNIGVRVMNNQTDVMANGSSAITVSGATSRISLGMPMTFTAGSAANPSINFINDTDLGLYRFGADTLGFATSGVHSLWLTGGAFPEIRGGAGNLSIVGGTGNNRSISLSATNASGTVVNAFSVTASSSVGQLVMDGNAQILASNATAASPSIRWDQGDGFYRFAADTMGVATAGVQTFLMGGGANAFLRGGAGNMTILAGTGASRTMTLQTTTSGSAAEASMILEGGGTPIWTGGASGNLNIRAGSGASRSILLGVTDAGSVNITALTLTSAIASFNSGVALRVNNNGTAAAPSIHFNDTNTGFYSLPSDTLGITTGGVVKLKIASNAATGAGDVALCITTADVLTKGATCGSSTMLIKTDIRYLDPVASTRSVMQMKPVRYSYKPGFYNERAEFGLLAEDMAAIDQRLAFYADRDDDNVGLKAGDPYNVNHNATLALLISTVQQQQKTIEQLQQRVTALEAKAKP